MHPSFVLADISLLSSLSSFPVALPLLSFRHFLSIEWLGTDRARQMRRMDAGIASTNPGQMPDIVHEPVFTLGNKGSQAEVPGTPGESRSRMHEAAC